MTGTSLRLTFGPDLPRPPAACQSRVERNRGPPRGPTLVFHQVRTLLLNPGVPNRVPINADKPHLWKGDINRSVDLFNTWFMEFAPKAFRETRIETTRYVARAIERTRDLSVITPGVIKEDPAILPTLRMATCPPIARDRLVGLAYTTKNLVNSLEKGIVPPRITASELDEHLARICKIVAKILDTDIFP